MLIYSILKREHFHKVFNIFENVVKLTGEINPGGMFKS